MSTTNKNIKYYYQEDGKTLKQEDLYREDGKTPEIIAFHKEDGKTLYELRDYDENGLRTRSNLFIHGDEKEENEGIALISQLYHEDGENVEKIQFFDGSENLLQEMSGENLNQTYIYSLHYKTDM